MGRSKWSTNLSILRSVSSGSTDLLRLSPHKDRRGFLMSLLSKRVLGKDRRDRVIPSHAGSILSSNLLETPPSTTAKTTHELLRVCWHWWGRHQRTIVFVVKRPQCRLDFGRLGDAYSPAAVDQCLTIRNHYHEWPIRTPVAL